MKDQSIVSPKISKTIEFRMSKISAQVAPIFQTKTYSAFKLFPENRPVRPSHVAQLVESMKEKYLPRVITTTMVGSDIFIIDGQHGFEAAKELGLPVYFQVVENLNVEDMVRLNKKNRSWSPSDYLHHYCVRGYEHYLTLQKFRKENLLDEVSVSDCVAILCSVNPGSTFLRTAGALEKFRDGKMVISEEAYDYGVGFASHLIEFEPYAPKHWKGRNFIHAVQHFYSRPEYDRHRMIEKIKKYGRGTLPTASSTVIGYGDALEDVYNRFARTDMIYINWKEIDNRVVQDDGGDKDE